MCVAVRRRAVFLLLPQQVCYISRRHPAFIVRQNEYVFTALLLVPILYIVFTKTYVNTHRPEEQAPEDARHDGEVRDPDARAVLEKKPSGEQVEHDEVRPPR